MPRKSLQLQQCEACIRGIFFQNNPNAYRVKKNHAIFFSDESIKTQPVFVHLFIYSGFYVAFNTVQVISRRVVGRAEETSTYSSLGFCAVNCRPTASNYLLSHLRPYQESNPGLRGGRRECYHSAAVAPVFVQKS